MKKYLIGYDIGTSAAKGVLIDPEGHVLGSHYSEYPTHRTKPQWQEHDPEDYWRSFKTCVFHILEQSGVSPEDIAGIGISSCGPNCILTDREGQSLGLCQTWMDRRGVSECDEIRRRYDDDEIFRITANPLDSQYGMVKLLWEKNNRPDRYRNAYKMLWSSGFLIMRLTGEFTMDYSCASITGVAYDIQKREWAADILENIGLDPDKLPQTYPCHQVVGTVTRKAALECGLRAGIPVVAGTVDSNAGWLSNGCVHPGDSSLVMGTAGCMCIVHDTPQFTRNLMNSIHVAHSDRYYTTLAGTANCGGLLHYLRDCFTQEEAKFLDEAGGDIYERFSEEAAKIPPGSDGLLILPYFAGERTPLWSPTVRGMAFGISLYHTRGHWVRAMMESGIYAVYHCLKLMEESGLYARGPVPVSEGGANSPVWRQIAADILDVEMVFMKDSKGAPLGDAINAGVGVGIFPDWDVAKDFAKVNRTHTPDPKAHAVYEKYYRLYRELYEDNKEKYEKLRILRDHD